MPEQPPRPRGGRPTKLTPEIVARLVEAIDRGASYRIACQYAGLSEATFMLWMQRGRRGSGEFREFLDQIEAAEGQVALRNVGVLEQAAADDWRAAAWWLERRYPDEWGRRERLDLTVVLDHEVETLAKRYPELPRTEIMQLADEIARRRSVR